MLVNKVIKYLSLLVAIFSVSSSFSVTNIIDFPLWLIPVLYSFFLFCLNDKDFATPGIIVFKIVMFFRYAVTPFAMYLQNDYYSYSANYFYMDSAIYLMLFEMLSVFTVLKLTESKSLGYIQHSNSQHFTFNAYGYSIMNVIILSLFVLIAVTHPFFLSGASLLSGGESSVSEEDISGTSGLIRILWQSSMTWLYLYYTFKFKSKNLSINYTIILSLFFLFLGFLGQDRISRWYTIICFLSVLFFLLKLYPDYKKRIMTFILLPSCGVIMVLSIFKNTDYLDSEYNSMSSEVVTLFDQKSLQNYFSGPVMVNNAIGLIENNHGELGFHTLLYDVIYNMPVVLHYVDPRHASPGHFNKYIGRIFGIGGISGDQIIPVIGQASIYFTYIFSPLLTILFVLFIRFFDKKYLTSNGLSVYVYVFSSTWFAVCSMMLNLTVLMSWVYSRIIPFFLLTWGTNRFSKYLKK